MACAPNRLLIAPRDCATSLSSIRPVCCGASDKTYGDLSQAPKRFFFKAIIEMPNSEDICERFWSLPSKPGEEVRREHFFLDDVIQKAHLEREIASRLDGVRTILVAGAGTGRFSIPLARQGFQVAHLDISQGMIDTARALAREAGVGLIRVDCFAGGDGALVRYYEKQGFVRDVEFAVPVNGSEWPGQVLSQRL